MKRKNYAKINLALDVVKKLNNNYHELDMVNVCINLYDVVNLEILKDSDDIIILCNNESVPTDEKNTIYKVVNKIKRNFNIKFGCKINIDKKIPVQAGMGGGSGNASVVLEMLNDYFNLKMSKIQMINFIKDISTDSCYLLTAIPSRVKGIGDIIEPIKCNLKNKLFVVKPKSGINTKEVYNLLNIKEINHPNINKICEALNAGNIDLLSCHIDNSLIKTASTLNGEVLEIIDTLKKLGFEIVNMSGSGSTCFAYSSSKEPYKKAKKAFKDLDYEIKEPYKIKMK